LAGTLHLLTSLSPVRGEGRVRGYLLKVLGGIADQGIDYYF